MVKCKHLFAAAAFLLFLALSKMTLQAEDEDEKEYLLSERSNLRKDPSVEGALLMTLPEGTSVHRIGGEQNGYVLVSCGDTKGYVLSRVLYKEGMEEGESERRQVITAKEARDAAMDVREGRSQYAAVLALNLSLPEEKPPVELQVISAANLRSDASNGSQRLARLEAGESVTYLGEAKNKYYHVSYGEMEGYIYCSCVDDEEVEDDLVSSVSTRPAAPSVSLPDISADEGGAIVSATAGGGGRTGSKTEKEKETLRADAAALDYKIGSRTNLRSLPDEEYKLLASLPAGSSVRILGQEGDYDLVQYKGLSGYVLSDAVIGEIDYAKQSGNPVLFIVTAYCSCKICCGEFSPEVRGGEAHTATGTVPEEGRTIAVDPKVIPYGSKVTIDGLGTYIAEDCGGGIRNNHIDVYFEEHEDAVEFGKQRLFVTINTGK